MASARSKKRRGAGARTFAARVTSEAAGLVLVGFGLIAAISLGTYSPADPLFELGSVHNRIGPVGATPPDRQSGVSGKSVAPGGRRVLQKTQH